jgi:hypothetical protein
MIGFEALSLTEGVSSNPSNGPFFADFLGVRVLLAPLKYTFNSETPEKFQVANAFRGTSNTCAPSLFSYLIVWVSFLNTWPTCQQDQNSEAQVILAPLNASEIWHICLFFTLPYHFAKLITTKKIITTKHKN